MFCVLLFNGACFGFSEIGISFKKITVALLNWVNCNDFNIRLHKSDNVVGACWAWRSVEVSKCWRHHDPVFPLRKPVMEISDGKR